MTNRWEELIRRLLGTPIVSTGGKRGGRTAYLRKWRRKRAEKARRVNSKTRRLRARKRRKRRRRRRKEVA